MPEREDGEWVIYREVRQEAQEEVDEFLERHRQHGRPEFLRRSREDTP